MKKITLLFALLTCFYANAQWTTDTAVNTLVINKISSDSQSIATSDGKTFIVFWKQVPAPINFELRVQLLDSDGYQQFGPEGMLISNTIPMSTSTVIWKIAIDSQNSLYVGATGTANGAGNPGFVYKISSNGTMLWGQNGISLGAAYLPTMLPLANGDVIINYWTGNGQSKIQRFTSDGAPIWATPVSVMSDNGTNATTPANMYELSNQEIMVVFHKKLSFGVASNLFAQKYNANGIAQWAAPTQLSNKGTAYNSLYSSTQDGNVIYYGYSGATGTRYDSYLQRINTDGTIPWGINGVDFDTNQTFYEMDTKVACTPGSQYVWSISKYTTSSQSSTGEFVQKFDKITGERQFTANAKQVYPVNTNYKNHTGDLYLVNDNPYFLIKSGIDNGVSPIPLNMVQLDSNGNFSWPEEFLPVATFSASKGRIVLNKPFNNESVVVFVEEKMSGEPRIYAQKFISPALSTNDFEVTDSFQLYPNPTNAIFTIKGNTSIQSVSIYNALGQQIYSNETAYTAKLTIGTNDWAKGLYIVNVATDNGIQKTIKLIKN
ncbi:T9SS type A sorting domain-containing protein [Flavobacterium sp.]|uniref:T9SS type A sorting domain-containing protein n=1 Tax=Flavobacterium sp. TaxID=239 RepID=UPI003D6C0DB2